MPQSNFVIDVNIYVSYIIGDKLDELFLLVLENDFEVFISNALINELSDVLKRDKFKKYLKKPVHEYIKAVRQFGYHMEPSPLIINSPDPKDDYLFVLALPTESTIVTGDKLLLNWKQAPVPIISLAKFKKTLSGKH
jgi:putative PIN family toxin of toxin-antitoxin system